MPIPTYGTPLIISKKELVILVNLPLILEEAYAVVKEPKKTSMMQAEAKRIESLIPGKTEYSPNITAL
jgi:hypothetical protein